MAFTRLLRESSVRLGVAAVLLAGPMNASAQDVQETSVQKLVERGAYDEAVQRADGERGNPESTYFAAQALVRIGDTGRARAEYARLRDAGGADWTAIAESGEAMVAGDLDTARAAADRAAAANGDNPFAHYQQGLIAARQSRNRDAADAFGRAVTIKPDLAYGHYYSGVAHQRLKEIPKMAEHFEQFMKLAPHAPEYGAVAGIMRGLRP